MVLNSPSTKTQLYRIRNYFTLTELATAWLLPSEVATHHLAYGFAYAGYLLTRAEREKIGLEPLDRIVAEVY